MNRQDRQAMWHPSSSSSVSHNIKLWGIRGCNLEAFNWEQCHACHASGHWHWLCVNFCTGRVHRSTAQVAMMIIAIRFSHPGTAQCEFDIRVSHWPYLVPRDKYHCRACIYRHGLIRGLCYPVIVDDVAWEAFLEICYESMLRGQEGIGSRWKERCTSRFDKAPINPWRYLHY